MKDYGHIMPARKEPYIVQANGTHGVKIALGAMLEIKAGDRLWEYKLPDGNILMSKARLH
jgi:hypothetical protein